MTSCMRLPTECFAILACNVGAARLSSAQCPGIFLGCFSVGITDLIGIMCIISTQREADLFILNTRKTTVVKFSRTRENFLNLCLRLIYTVLFEIFVGFRVFEYIYNYSYTYFILTWIFF